MDREVRYMTEEEVTASTTSLVDSLAKAAAAGAEASATLKALCEVMHVDEVALKERMVINALKEKRTLEPSLENDALEVIERLIAERDMYKSQRDKLRRDCDERYDAYKHERDLRMKLEYKICRATTRLSPPNRVVFGKLEKKRRYTKDEVINAQIDILDQMRDHEDKIIKILTEDFEE